MKSLFPGHFKLSDDELNHLWNKATFVFDANILLGLYRYSEETRREFLKLLASLKARCWLPYQSTKEYFDNRLGVIGQQEDSYLETVKSIEEIEGKFKNVQQHPFLSGKTLDGLCRQFEEVRNDLNNRREFYAKQLKDDDILREIESIFADTVGQPFEAEELDKIYSEGEARYKAKIPPGYKDGKKQDEIESMRRYGDLVLWKEILNKAAKNGNGIIFVCDDKKEDWWLQFKGKTIGPRPELIREFASVSKGRFHMYTSDRFLEFAGTHFGKEISDLAVMEMRELKRSDEERWLHASRHYLELERMQRKFSDESDSLNARLVELHGRDQYLRETMRSMHAFGRSRESLEMSESHIESLAQINGEMKAVADESRDIRRRLMEYSELEARLRSKVMNSDFESLFPGQR
jgi:hypothetical protein